MSSSLGKGTSVNVNCVCLEDYRILAEQKLPKEVFTYIDSGSGSESTKQNNHNAFSQIVMIPRILRDASRVSTETTLFGKKCRAPFGFAPWAMNKIVHEKGELVPARIAGDNNLAYILSTLTNTSVSDIQKVNPNGIKMLQLYLSNNQSRNLKLVKIAEAAGFDALVITVDAQVLGVRRREERHKLDSSKYQFPLLEELLEGQDGPKERVAYLRNRDLTMNWDTIAKLRKQTSLKIVLKGILHPRDAQIATKYCDAIYVSNHGGRQLDTVPATIEALPAVVAAVHSQNSLTPILFDGGILTGGDIFKALALGASYVFVGRPVAYALVEGETGVQNIVNILEEELVRTMALNGACSLKQIGPHFIGMRSKL